MIVVAKNLSVLQLFISRMPKMCAILQLVSAPLNPIPMETDVIPVGFKLSKVDAKAWDSSFP